MEDAELNPTVLIFFVGLTVLTTLLFGVFPSYAITRSNLLEAIKRGRMRGTVGDRRGMRRGFVTTQVALAVVLLAGAGLLLRSYAKVLGTPTGFSPSTTTASIQFSSQLAGVAANPRYDTSQKRKVFFSELVDRLQQSHGVVAAGLIDYLPLSRAENLTSFEAQGYPNEINQWAEFRRVTPGYFSAMQIPLMYGQGLSNADGPGDPGSVIVNQAFAAKYFGKGDATGRHIRMSTSDPWITVVGVIADLRNMDLETIPVPQIYTHLWQADTNEAPVNGIYIAVRSSLPPGTVIEQIRSVVQSLDSRLPIANIRTMSEVVAEATARRRFQTTILTAFSVMALLLAVVGLYGLLAYSVEQRSDELGIRMALGSRRMGVVKLVLGEGLMLFGFGLGIGLAVSLGISRLLAGFLYGVPATDPLTYALMFLLLLVGTLAACLVPSIRAAAINPMEALRHE